MVKGVSRRVVIVRPPDSRIFEQAIFIVRENGATARDIMREACSVAETYLKNRPVRRYYRRRWSTWHLGAASIFGGGIVGLAWALTALLC